jgi:hypothetical protein
LKIFSEFLKLDECQEVETQESESVCEEKEIVIQAANEKRSIRKGFKMKK